MAIDIQNIKNLEEYFAKLQKIQLNIEAEGSQIDKIIKKHAIRPDFYTVAGISSLRREMEGYLAYITKITGDTGKLMASKAMGKFLEKAELRDITRKQLRAINQLNSRQITRRIELFKMQITKETTYLKSQIDEFLLNARISGRTRPDVLKELIRAAGDDKGLGVGFAKKMKRVSVDAARREAQQRAMMEFRKMAKPGEHYKWVAVSVKPCPDCSMRAGVILSWAEWTEMGRPGDGRTVCGFSCKCQLMPESLAEEMFPNIKEFKWDKDKAVLTTASEMRTFKAHRG